MEVWRDFLNLVQIWKQLKWKKENVSFFFKFIVLKKKDYFFWESLLEAGGSKHNLTYNLEIKAYFKMKDLFLSLPGVKNWNEPESTVTMQVPEMK